MTRRIFIGDVQGCRAELEDLLREVGFDAAHDELHPVGDLVNPCDLRMAASGIALPRALDQRSVCRKEMMLLSTRSICSSTPEGVGIYVTIMYYMHIDYIHATSVKRWTDYYMLPILALRQHDAEVSPSPSLARLQKDHSKARGW